MKRFIGSLTLTLVALLSPLSHAGEPLVSSAIVTRPAAIDGVESWTIDTVHPRGSSQALAIHPTQPVFLTGGGDSVVRMWNLDTFEFERAWIGHAGWVSIAEWTPDGKRLATGAYDDEVLIWDAEKGEVLTRIKAQTGGVYTLTWAADGSWIATAGDGDDNLRVWNPQTGELIRHLQGHKKSTLASELSPDGQWLAAASDDTFIRIWDVATWEQVKVLKGHPTRIRGISWSPDGSQLISGGNDGVLRVWNVAEEKLLSELSVPDVPDSTAIYGVDWSSDGKLAAVAYSDNVVRTWSAGDGILLRSFATDGVAPPMMIRWQANSHHLLSLEINGGVTRWDAETGDRSAQHPGRDVRAPAVAWSSSSRHLACSTTSGKLIFWEPASGGIQEIDAHDRAIRSLTSNPENDLFASASDDHTVRLWNAASGELQATLSGHATEVQVVAFSPDGQLLASGGNDKQIRLWKPIASGQPPRVLDGASGAVWAFAWSADGKVLASGDSGGNIIVWDVTTGEIKHRFKGPSYGVRSLAWVPGEKQIAAGSYPELRVWDIETGDVERELEGHVNWVYSLKSGTDPAIVASCSRDRTIRVWDLTTGEQLRTHRGHAGQIDTLDWSPDGRTLATGSTWDGTIRLWNAETLEAGLVLLPLPEGAVAISPEGHVQATDNINDNLAVIVKTAEGQQTYRPDEFAKEFGWKNSAAQVRLRE